MREGPRRAGTRTLFAACHAGNDHSLTVHPLSAALRETTLAELLSRRVGAACGIRDALHQGIAGAVAEILTEAARVSFRNEWTVRERGNATGPGPPSGAPSAQRRHPFDGGCAPSLSREGNTK